VYSSSELNRDRTGASNDIQDESMTVGELVRSIGGAKDAPLRKCDVVEDRSAESVAAAAAANSNNNNNGDEDGENKEEEEEDPQADEFYASLGLPNPNENSKQEGNSTNNTEQGQSPLIIQDADGDGGQSSSGRKLGNENFTAEVADFYKTYTKYYYSQEPDPYGEQRLAFGLPITQQPTEDENEMTVDYNAGDQTIIQLARMAQVRARQAKAAAEALEKAKKAKALDPGGEVGPENEAEMYDPLPMEVVPRESAEELGITLDTTLEQYWEVVKEDPHDFNRWIYLIHYVEGTVSYSKLHDDEISDFGFIQQTQSVMIRNDWKYILIFVEKHRQLSKSL
jgi:hypothetical protein